MSIFSAIIGAVTGTRIEKSVKIYSPGERDGRAVICHRCEKELGPDHDDDECAHRGFSRRTVLLGLLGAPAAALAARELGVPIPQARIQVVARSGDMFEVETLNPFTIAWEGARTSRGTPFKADNGLAQGGGILSFHGQDLSRPDKWLRVHRGLAEMNVLALVDTVTGKPVKYRIIRNEEAEKTVRAAYQRIQFNHRAMAENLWKTQGYKIPDRPIERGTLDVPVDNVTPGRQGSFKAKAEPNSGETFLIDYHAADHKNGDRVAWRRAEHPAMKALLFFPASKPDLRPQQFTGSLHDAIAAINQHYPENAGLLRKTIMSMNPEYRKRVAPVRTVEKERA